MDTHDNDRGRQQTPPWPPQPVAPQAPVVQWGAPQAPVVQSGTPAFPVAPAAWQQPGFVAPPYKNGPSWGPVTPKAEPKPAQGAPKSDPNVTAGEPSGTSQGRFQKGKSGNLKGRPPNRERTYTARQFSRDFLSEVNRVVEVNGKRVPAINVIIRHLVDAAMGGNQPAINLMFRYYDMAVKNYELGAKGEIDTLNFHERVAAKSGAERTDRNLARVMNEMRRRSRDL